MLWKKIVHMTELKSPQVTSGLANKRSKLGKAGWSSAFQSIASAIIFRVSEERHEMRWHEKVIEYL